MHDYFLRCERTVPREKKGEERAEYKTMQEMWGQAVKTQDERRRLYWEVDPNDVEDVIVE